MRFSSRGWLRLSMLALLLSLMFALVGNLATGTVEPSWSWWVPAVWCAAGLLLVGSLLVGYLLLSRAQDEIGKDDQALADLATRLEADWSEEAVQREVTRPAPLRVAWCSTGRPAASRKAVLDDPLGGDWWEVPLRGLTDVPSSGQSATINQQIVKAFRQLPRRHMMVLGGPGGGKSAFAILLTLGLIRTRSDDEPVPVLLPINEWDPVEPIDVFVSRRLAEDYEKVLGRYGTPRQVADRLVTAKQILPVLDGLDELRASAIGSALDALDRYASTDRPLVVTCRSREYEQIVTRTGTVLATAAVVELESVTIDAMIDYLSFPEAAEPRWKPVLDYLKGLNFHSEEARGAARNDPLAVALSTPLMVSLARAAYRQPKSRPAELLDFRSQEEVAGRLMDAFATAAFTTGKRPRRGRCQPYESVRARRWLECLASHMRQTGTRDWQWWRLKSDFLSIHPRQVRVLTVAVAAILAGFAAGLIGFAASLSATWAAVAGGTVVTVAAAGLLRPVWPSSYPSYTRTRFRDPRLLHLERLGLLTVYSTGGGALAGLVIGHLHLGLVAGLILGWLTNLIQRPMTLSEARGPIRHAAPSCLIAATTATRCALAGGTVFACTSMWVHVSPISAGVTAGLLYGAGAGLGAGGWSWIRYRLAVSRLALKGQLPWRLRAFLAYAHQQGILRRAGAIYQFRHVILQDHLASSSPLDRFRVRSHIDNRDMRCLAPRLTDRHAWDDGEWNFDEMFVEGIILSGQVEKLWDRADAGDGYAAWRLAEVLADGGHIDEAVGLLRARADSNDHDAAWRLAELLTRHGYIDEAVGLLQALVDTGYHGAARRLAVLQRQVADEGGLGSPTKDR